MGALKSRMIELEDRLKELKERRYILSSELKNDNWYTPKGIKAKVLKNRDKIDQINTEIYNIEDELALLGYYGYKGGN